MAFGVLLVTPGPGAEHQAISSRIAYVLCNAVQAPGLALVYASGAVSFPRRTQLEPDILVVPAHFPIKDKWADTSEHWLAVEILSPSSRVYDREFKRDAYLALVVREVWLVDKLDRSVEVSRAGGAQETVRDAVLWQVPGLEVVVRVDLSEVFAGIA